MEKQGGRERPPSGNKEGPSCLVLRVSGEAGEGGLQTAQEGLREVGVYSGSRENPKAFSLGLEISEQ